MNREDIIRMAREADREWDCDRDMVEWLEWFAALIASRVAAKASAAAKAEEREACAKVCEDMRPSEATFDRRFFVACTLNANAIRERGTQ